MQHRNTPVHGSKHTLPAFCLLIFICAFIVTGCGSDATADSSKGGTPQVPTVGAVPTQAVSAGTPQGCPSTATVTAPPKANVAVSESDKDQTVTLHQGDVVEFRLSYGKKWSGPSASVAGLELQGPAGYASNAHSACIWDFTAKSTGTMHLTFDSQALCKRGELCPQYIISYPFNVQVK